MRHKSLLKKIFSNVLSIEMADRSFQKCALRVDFVIASGIIEISKYESYFCSHETHSYSCFSLFALFGTKSHENEFTSLRNKGDMICMYMMKLTPLCVAIDIFWVLKNLQLHRKHHTHQHMRLNAITFRFIVDTLNDNLIIYIYLTSDRFSNKH